jgi:hypothetical protein
MTLQQTLSVNNSAAALGNIQIQPVNDVSGIVLSAKTTPSLSSLGGVAANEVTISPSLLHFGNQVINVIKNVNLGQIVDLILSNDIYALAPLESSYNTISLTFPQLNEINKQTTFSEKIKSEYESFTNISQTRPEILSVIDFLPIFDNDTYQQKSASDIDPTLFMTSAGKFVNTQMQVRNLLFDNISSMIESLRKINKNLSQSCDAASNDFYNGLLTLQSKLQILNQLLLTINDTKQHFNIHDSSYILNASDIIDAFVSSYATDKTSANQLKTLNINYGFNIKSLTDVFVKLGYVEQAVTTNFSSTKLWLQLLSEYKTILSYHSLDFLELDHTTQKNDINANTITSTTNSSFFYVVNNNIAIASDFITEKIASDLVTNVADIAKTYSSLYSVAFKTNNIKISSLLLFLSKEYRFSLGINENADLLLNSYNYTIKKSDYTLKLPENIKVFEQIFGTQKNITETSGNVNSISALSQTSDGVNNILTFETQQLNSGNNSFLAGGEYYLNNANVLDTTKISNFSTLLDKTLQSFCKTAVALDFVCSNNSNATDYSLALNNPANLFVLIFNRFQDLSISSDTLCPVFALANKNVQLKSALFLYMMYVINGVNVTADLFDEIVGIIQANVTDISKTLKTMPDSSLLINNETIEGALYDGTNLMSLVREIFGGVITTYDVVMSDFHTIYGGLSNLTLYLVIFDIVVALCDGLGSNAIIGKTFINSLTQQSVLTYVLSPVNTSSHASQDFVMTIVGKLNGETATSQIMFYSVYAILTNLQSSIKNYINNVNAKNVLDTIQSIKDVIGDRQKYLMSTQQIYLLNNSLVDVFEKFNVSTSSTLRSTFSVNTSVKSFDDFEVSSTLRNAFLNVFSDPMFTSKKGSNKKLFTIGVPQGLSDSLRQQSSTQNLTSYQNKQIDLINLCVYKIDIVYDDIVYKPQKFLFDLSRFTPRNDALYIQNTNKTLLDVVMSIPTRDVAIINDATNVQYYSPSNTSLTAAFDATYDFLSNEQKYQIAKNHVLSLMIEHYIRFLTGVSVSEDSFTMGDIEKLMDADLLKQLIDTYIMLVTSTTATTVTSDVVGGVFFSNIIQNSLQNSSTNVLSLATQQAMLAANSSLTNVSQNVFDAVMQGIRTMSGMSYSLTSLSDKTQYSKKILMPKIFDRVFNVVIDPDDFEIDVQETNKSKAGTQTLLQLISTGDVIATIPNTVTNVTTQLATNNVKTLAAGTTTNQYTFTSKDKNEGDPTFEKYFFTIETFSNNALTSLQIVPTVTR